MSKLLAKDCYGTNQLSDTLRIKRVLWHPPALFGSCFVLQEKGLFGFWWTKSWIYVSILENDSAEYIEEWLRWEAGMLEEQCDD